MTSPVRAPRVLEQYERAVTVLLDAGFAATDVVPLLIALGKLVLGTALEPAAPGDDVGADRADPGPAAG